MTHIVSRQHLFEMNQKFGLQSAMCVSDNVCAETSVRAEP